MYVRKTRSVSLPKSLLSLSLLAAGFGVWGSAAATTYYVRTNGGDATQCNGRADAAYPGSGTAQNCAWKNPMVAIPASGTPRIAGGDTLLISSGSYQIGSGGMMQRVPSGPSSTAPTRILGNGATAPKLVGSNGIHRVLNLEGSSNVELGNLEVTDGSDCIYNHSDAAINCSGSNWAKHGLYATGSSNVWMHDVNIHGLGHTGILAGGLTNWTLERVKSNKNSRAGWDGGNLGANAGKMILRDIEFGWNGCGERVSTGEPWACWGQQTGGYGDGFASTTPGGNGGQWLIEDAYVHHNTQDGLDFYYMNGADGSSVTMRRVHVVNNAGHNIKIKGNALIENSVIAAHCSYFKSKYNMLDTDLCRGYGASVLLVLTGNDTATVRHNTIAGEGPNLIHYQEGASTDKIYIQNNVGVGFPYYRGSGQAGFAGGPAPGAKSLSGNLAWNTGNCPSGTTCGTSPKLTNMALATFDAEPLSDSPVVDKAPMISSVTTDFVLGKRPTGTANDIGAYEFGAGGSTEPTPPPTPTCTAAAPTLSMTGPTAAVAAGTANTYSLTLRNNDSTGCANTSFAVARSVPTGWTGTLSASSVTLSPGASANVSLAVTSPTSATAGTYGIGSGVSSSKGSVHTANASAIYSVAAPVTSCTRKAPTITVSGPTTAVTAGTTAKYTVSVRNNDGSCYTGKTFSLANSVPSGWTGAFAQSSSYIYSGATFTTTLSVKSASSAAAGTYPIGVRSSTSLAVHTANATAAYSVAAPVTSCTRKAPTITVSGPTTAVTAGTTVKYTVSVRNNDGSCYTGKTFSLANSVPSGWTGTFAQSSSYIYSGATFTTTLSVKSASSAAAGTYPIGVRSSTSLAVHSASSSSSYAVK